MRASPLGSSAIPSLDSMYRLVAVAKLHADVAFAHATYISRPVLLWHAMRGSPAAFSTILAPNPPEEARASLPTGVQDPPDLGAKPSAGTAYGGVPLSIAQAIAGFPAASTAIDV